MAGLRICVVGEVQGVGFRPFVVREATRRGLSGWVRNVGDAVEAELYGAEVDLQALARVVGEGPAAARVDGVEVQSLEHSDVRSGVRIGPSRVGGGLGGIGPDLALCEVCADEVRGGGRRAGYAFTSCPECGPRFTIGGPLPFDRPRSAMAAFPLCAACRAEHEDPGDRRFHAQATACPECGPRTGSISEAVAALRQGAVLGLKGVGGFQLLCDPDNPEAVAELRRRKSRPDKPLARLYPSIGRLREDASVSPAEAEWLGPPVGAIVLLDGGRLGAMLPTTPLHLLLAEGFGGPLICTSGNRSGEPMATEVLPSGLADHILDHNRPVLQGLDDSVVRLDAGAPILLRRARGLAPRVLPLPHDGPTVLALGAHLKGSVALAVGRRALVGHSLGPLDSLRSEARFEAEVERLLRVATPDLIACDAHPDYASTRYAEELAARLGVPLVRVFHHHAHAAAVMGEHGVEEAVALTWDGVGLGEDGLAWGGEALAVEGGSFRRVAHLRPFPLLGGDAVARAPWRAALGLLLECGIPWPGLPGVDPQVVDRLSRTSAPRTTSVGRLFDAVAALVGGPVETTYEAQAAQWLERRGAGVELATAGAPWDPAPLLAAIIADPDPGRGADRLVSWLADTAWSVAAPDQPLVCAGGCFQSAALVRAMIERARGRPILLARALPPNDEALSFGQVVVARSLARSA